MDKKLNEILLEIPNIPEDIVITGLQDDSRNIKKGNLFLAYQGEQIDRKIFIEEVKANGAIVVSDQKGCGDYYLKNLKAKIGELAERFWNFPSKKLRIIGITGTNGKTTIAYLIYQILNQFGINTAFVGTLGVIYQEKVYRTLNTTLGALALTEWFARMCDAGISVVVMEVSAHALSQFRVEHINFDRVIFTNLTRDHLDYYSDFSNYAYAKSQLFYHLTSNKQIFNLDDTFGEKWFKDFKNTGISYGLSNVNSLVTINDYKCTLRGTEGYIVTPWGKGFFKTSLIGRFNLGNCLAVVASLGDIIEFKKLLDIFKRVKAPNGRLDILQKGNSPWIIVDYAHTPDALEKILLEMRFFNPRKLGIIFGCGGDRDRGKRKIMGEIASRLADWVIITNDNTRSEDPEKIATMILEGVSNKNCCLKISDRREAIEFGIKNSGQEDIVVVAGRGHEDCLLLGSKKMHFIDREEVERNLQCY